MLRVNEMLPTIYISNLTDKEFKVFVCDRLDDRLNESKIKRFAFSGGVLDKIARLINQSYNLLTTLIPNISKPCFMVLAVKSANRRRLCFISSSMPPFKIGFCS